jgi:hypothetical protein
MEHGRDFTAMRDAYVDVLDAPDLNPTRGVTNCGLCTNNFISWHRGGPDVPVPHTGITHEPTWSSVHQSEFVDVSLDDLYEMMSASPDGAAGFIGIHTGGDVGHMIAVVNRGGTVWFVDPQARLATTIGGVDSLFRFGGHPRPATVRFMPVP